MMFNEHKAWEAKQFKRLQGKQKLLFPNKDAPIENCHAPNGRVVKYRKPTKIVRYKGAMPSLQRKQRRLRTVARNALSGLSRFE